MPAPPLIAWVDAVGAVLLRPGERLTLGGPPKGGEAADLPLVAPLKPVHAAVVRAGEGWAIEDADGSVAPLAAEGAFALGPDGVVRGTVRAPHPLSASAVVTVTGHRPAPGWGPVRLEHVVIAAGPVLIGPGAECHVRVRGAAAPLLFRATDAGWQVRGAEDPDGRAGGSAALGWRAVAAGDAAAGGGVSLRLEALSSG